MQLIVLTFLPVRDAFCLLVRWGRRCPLPIPRPFDTFRVSISASWKVSRISIIDLWSPYEVKLCMLRIFNRTFLAGSFCFCLLLMVLFCLFFCILFHFVVWNLFMELVIQFPDRDHVWVSGTPHYSDRLCSDRRYSDSPCTVWTSGGWLQLNRPTGSTDCKDAKPNPENQGQYNCVGSTL